jgi:uncharacterized HAD superfamily protein
MKIAFDMDGVLCDIDIPALNLINNFYDGEKKLVEDIKYYMSRRPLLNPEDMLHEGDEYIVITARYDGLEEVTTRWLKKYCPNYKELYIVGSMNSGFRSDYEGWKLKSVKEKIKIMEEYGTDVYFDDNPSLVGLYRELTDIPVIQYGGRFLL